MNFFKRASTSILRTPGKTVVLLLLVFILGTVIAGAIAVEGAIHNTEAHLRNNMRPIVSFSVDQSARDAYRAETGERAPETNLTPDVVREIASLPYVAVHNYAIITSFSTKSLRSYDVMINFTDGSVGGSTISDFGEVGNHIEVTGSSTTELFEVREGLLELVGGRMFTGEEIVSAGDVHPVIISRRLAERNNLSLQSTFEIELTTLFPQIGSWSADWGSDPSHIFYQEIMRFEVVGLVELVSDILDIPQDPNDMDMDAGAVFALLHTFFLPNASAEIIHRFQTEMDWEAIAYLIERDGLDYDDIWWFDPTPEYKSEVRSIMELYDPHDLEAFRIAAQPMLPDFWVIDDLLHTFDDVRASMEGLQSIANWVLWVALGATLLILSLIITLFLRDRRHEIGVYLALGEKKTRIISQILMEVVVVALIGMTLSVFAGSIISNAMTQEMIRNELVAEPAHRFDSGGGGWEGVNLEHMNVERGITLDELVEAFDLSLNGGTIGLFYVIGLGTVVLSTVLPIIYVIRLNPKKVLMGN